MIIRLITKSVSTHLRRIAFYFVVGFHHTFCHTIWIRHCFIKFFIIKEKRLRASDVFKTSLSPFPFPQLPSTPPSDPIPRHTHNHKQFIFDYFNSLFSVVFSHCVLDFNYINLEIYRYLISKGGSNFLF